MTVKELRDLLLKYDQNLSVITRRYSDYKHLTTEDISVEVVEAIDTGDEWLKHPFELNMTPPYKNDSTLASLVREQARKTKYLYIKGN